MSNKIITDSRAYFAALSSNKPISNRIIPALAPLTDSGAKKLAQCGQYGIGYEPIQLLQAESGHIFAKGAKWCGSRYCPHCWPRMVSMLQSWRAGRAEAALACGLGIVFLRYSVPRCVPGELAAALVELKRIRKETFPAPSRLPAAWRTAGLTDFLGLDWNIELDWCATSEMWHVHMHALAFKPSPWSPAQLNFMRSIWPAEAESYAEESTNPGGAARYAVKVAPNDPERLTLFGLASAGLDLQVAELVAATFGQRLRGNSEALRLALGLSTRKEDDSALAEALERQPGALLESLTLSDWRSRW